MYPGQYPSNFLWVYLKCIVSWKYLLPHFCPTAFSPSPGGFLTITDMLQCQLLWALDPCLHTNKTHHLLAKVESWVPRVHWSLYTSQCNGSTAPALRPALISTWNSHSQVATCCRTGANRFLCENGCHSKHGLPPHSHPLLLLLKQQVLTSFSAAQTLHASATSGASLRSISCSLSVTLLPDRHQTGFQEAGNQQDLPAASLPAVASSLGRRTPCPR